MGTSIRVNAWKGEETTIKQWEEFKDLFAEYYEEIEDCEDMIEAPCVYTSYRCADLETQMSGFKKFKGSGIEFNLFFLECDPDETEVL